MFFISHLKPDPHMTSDKAWIGKKNATQNPCNLTQGSSMKYWWEIKYMLHPIVIPPLGNPLYQCITFLWFYIYNLVYLPPHLVG